MRKKLSCLDDGQWYNDDIIDYCLTKECEVALFEGHSCLVSQWNLGKVDEDDFSVFSCFLIPRAMWAMKGLMPLPSGTGWILGGNYSLCEFLVFPINFENTHWSLGIVWLAPTPGRKQWKRCILYLDSLSLSDSLSSSSSELRDKVDKVEEKCGAIRTYLNSLSSDVNSDVNTTDNLPVIHVNVPQQDNCYDCGLFVLHYAILFITCQNKRELATDLIDGKKENWFGGVTREEVSKFVHSLRRGIRDAVVSQIANLKPLTADESKTTVEQITSDGIVEFLSSSEESESDEDSLLNGDELMQKLEDNLRKQKNGDEKKKNEVP